MSLLGAEVGECTADEARRLTDQITTGVEAVWHLIALAYQGRAWAALGYASWDDYTTREFGTSRLRLPREERQEVVASLRESGLSIRAIASATGTGTRQVQEALAEQVCSETTPDPEPVDGVMTDEEQVNLDPHGPRSANPAPAKPITGTDGKAYPAPKPRPTPPGETTEKRRAREAEEAIQRNVRRLETFCQVWHLITDPAPTRDEEISRLIPYDQATVIEAIAIHRKGTDQ